MTVLSSDIDAGVRLDVIVQLFVLASSAAAACYVFQHRSLCKNMNLRSAIDLTQSSWPELALGLKQGLGRYL